MEYPVGTHFKIKEIDGEYIAVEVTSDYEEQYKEDSHLVEVGTRFVGRLINGEYKLCKQIPVLSV